MDERPHPFATLVKRIEAETDFRCDHPPLFSCDDKTLHVHMVTPEGDKVKIVWEAGSLQKGEARDG